MTSAILIALLLPPRQIVTGLSTMTGCMAGPVGHYVRECNAVEGVPLLSLCVEHTECAGVNIDGDGDVDLMDWSLLCGMVTAWNDRTPEPLQPLCIHMKGNQ